jgi:hypothetical protein
MARSHLLAAVATVVVVVAQLTPLPAGYPWPVCGSSKSFKPNSKYKAYLNLAAATLPRNASASPDLYAAAVIGSAPEQLWATGLCRGDINASDCFSCLTQAFQDLENDCSFIEDATIYYDTCILHYSNVRVVSQGETGPVPYNANVTSDPARFNRLVAALMNATADHAAVRHRGGRLRRPGVSQGVQLGAVHAGPNADAVQEMPRRSPGERPRHLPEQYQRKDAWGELHLQVRHEPLLPWTGDGAHCVTTELICSASASAGRAAKAAAAGRRR